MRSGARRTANNFAAIERPALLTQYSPRCGDAISADTDVTNTMAREYFPLRPLLNEQSRHRLRQKVRTLQIGAQHLLETLLGGREQIGSARVGHGRRCSRARAACRNARRSTTPIAADRSGCRYRPSSTQALPLPSDANSLTTPAHLFTRAKATQRERPPPLERSEWAIPSPMPRVPPVTKRDTCRGLLQASTRHCPKTYSTLPFGHPLNAERRLPQMVVAPHARLAARNARAAGTWSHPLGR